MQSRPRATGPQARPASRCGTGHLRYFSLRMNGVAARPHHDRIPWEARVDLVSEFLRGFASLSDEIVEAVS